MGKSIHQTIKELVGQETLLDRHAVIEPGKSAAGVSIGEPIRPLSQVELHTVHDLGNGSELFDFGSVRVWARGGIIEQVGVRGQYDGCVRGTLIGVGSTLDQVVTALGAVVEDDEDNLIVINLPGLCFETDIWHGDPGRETVEKNIDAKLTEIFIFGTNDRR